MSNVEFNAIGGGDTPAPFLGTFNGNGYTISNLKIESSNKTQASLLISAQVVKLQILNW